MHKHTQNGANYLIFHPGFLDFPCTWQVPLVLTANAVTSAGKHVVCFILRNDEISSKAIISMLSANASKKSLTSA